MTSYKVEHEVSIDDRCVKELLLECRVLSHVNIRILWHELHDVLNPCKNVVCIALVILLVSLIDNIVKYDNDVLTYEECIVLRTHLLSELRTSLIVTLCITVVVMVTDDRIYRNTCAYDCFLVLCEELENIPACVTKCKTYCLALKDLTCLSKVIDRICCKDCMVRICLSLDITDSEDVVVNTVTCLDKVEIKLRAALSLSIVCRHTCAPVSCIS